MKARITYSCIHDHFGKHIIEYDPAGDTWCDRPPDRDLEDQPILVLDEDGEFRVDWNGGRGEKNILHGEWSDIIVSGQFALVPIPGTISIDFTGTA